MATSGVDPCVLRDVSAVEQQIDIGNRDLRVVDAGDDQHRRRRLAEKSLGHERQLGKFTNEIAGRLDAFDDT